LLVRDMKGSGLRAQGSSFRSYSTGCEAQALA
jgi:hypothetical protein